MTAKDKLLLEIKKHKDKFVTREECKNFNADFFDFALHYLKLDCKSMEKMAYGFMPVGIRSHMEMVYNETKNNAEQIIDRLETIFKKYKSKEIIRNLLSSDFEVLHNRAILNKENSEPEGIEFIKYAEAIINEYDAEICIQIYINMVKNYFVENRNTLYGPDIIYSFFMIQQLHNKKIDAFLEEQEFLKKAIKYMEDCINTQSIISINELDETKPLVFFAKKKANTIREYFYELVVRYDEELRMQNNDNEKALPDTSENSVQVFIDDENPITPFHDKQIRELIDNIIKYGNKCLEDDITSLLLNRDVDKLILIKEVIYRLKKRNINHNTNKALIFLNKKLREMEEKNKGNEYKLKRNFDDKNGGC